MTSGYLENITPDSFSGEVFAFEGIERAITLVNGPSGCKFYHSATADFQTIRQPAFDPLAFPDEWFFGQPRVPCTYLDTRDYVYGSRDKLREAARFLRENVSFDLLCVVNSPGAALIGDDLREIAGAAAGKPCVTIESPGFSANIGDGYENAVIRLVQQLGLKKTNIRPGRVNILGLSIFHKYWAGDARELRRLFALSGIEAGCFVCAGCGVDDLRTIPAAALNVVLRPEYGLRSAQRLEEEFGTPFYLCPGPPVGFSATEKMITDLCALLGKNADAFRRASEKARARAFVHIARVHSLTGLPKAALFAVEGDYAEIYAYVSFLVRHFGMVLETASALNPETAVFRDRLKELLTRLKMSGALGRDILDTQGELVFANGNTIAKLKLRGHVFSGIEIALPSLGYLDVLPRTHIGLAGALTLTEQVLNGLMFR
ncbi:MAG: nitrogenase component 1 [Gracilibacteraceae bacterium]|jgi:nitrogenase molybdenum-iron protein alpha/beta subunit|nr:nitrogenase component 1 [Gracilibacteraceae bacterium]